MSATKRKTPGIQPRRGRDGRTRYLAEAFDSRTGKKIRRSFPTHAAAKAWRADATSAIRSGKLAPASALTFGEAADELLEGMDAGTVTTRSGRPYKPSAIRGYRRSIDLRLRPKLGTRKLGEIRRGELQRMIDGWAADGLGASTIRNALDPLRVVYRRAVTREIVSASPCDHLEVPRTDGKRDRIASPEEAAKLIDALPPEERAVWACAMYAGLRRGELRALRWSDLDLASGRVRVERGWDAVEGPIEGKTAAARRSVPLTATLRDLLVEHRLTRSDSPDNALVFGRTDEDPFIPSTVNARAKRAWKAAKLAPITMHEARHTFASTCIAANVNPKALSAYMGHSNVSITFDTYGHLMPGNEDESAALIDGYLRAAQVPVKSQSGAISATPGADLSGPERNGEEPAIPVAKPESA